MKRCLSSVLAFLMLLPLAIIGVSAADGVESTTVTGFNTTRTADSVIVYTASGEKTGTNQWGIEAIVGSDGRIISVGGNDNTVPEGGFVISGHGDGADWVRAHCRAGRYARALEGVGMLFVSDEPVSPFYSFTLKVDGVNRAPLDGEITVFDSRYGKPATGTEYGTQEAAVSDDGIIVYVSDYCNAIPSKGFIISGKGAGAEAVLTKLRVGMKAKFNADDNTVSIVYDAESMLYADSDAADEAYEAAEAAEADSRDIDFAACTELYDKITAAIDAAEELIKTGTEAEFLSAREKIAEDIARLRGSAELQVFGRDSAQNGKRTDRSVRGQGGDVAADHAHPVTCTDGLDRFIKRNQKGFFERFCGDCEHGVLRSSAHCGDIADVAVHQFCGDCGRGFPADVMNVFDHLVDRSEKIVRRAGDPADCTIVARSLNDVSRLRKNGFQAGNQRFFVHFRPSGRGRGCRK